MRIDARSGAACVGWTIFDVATCSTPQHVVWVDDELAQWGQWDTGWPWSESIVTRQERRITIYPGRKLILFNEVDDESSADSAKTGEDSDETRAGERAVVDYLSRRIAAACRSG